MQLDQVVARNPEEVARFEALTQQQPEWGLASAADCSGLLAELEEHTKPKEEAVLGERNARQARHAPGHYRDRRQDSDACDQEFRPAKRARKGRNSSQLTSAVVSRA